MARSRASAKAAGTRFESLIAGYLNRTVDDRIERRTKTGARDRGDVANLRLANNSRVVVECKDEAKISLGTWMTETETERLNDGAVVGVIAHKRRGKGKAEEQWVTMTMADFVALVNGVRPEPEEAA